MADNTLTQISKVLFNCILPIWTSPYLVIIARLHRYIVGPRLHIRKSKKYEVHQGLWHLWLERNNFLFRIGVVDRMIHMKRIRDSAEFFSIRAKIRCNKMKTVILVAWEKPPIDWMKLNSDGSALGNPRKARGGGGLIQDHQGNWVRGYARSLGNTSSSIAKL